MPLDIQPIIERLERGDQLEEFHIKFICCKAKDILMEESNVVPISPPVTIVGDIHGQFYDLLEIFRIGGKPPDTNYLFLGDYVDRGYYSVETIALLLCYKIRYPARITMLRGNHETRSISQMYGFLAECTRKYKGSAKVWHMFMEVFDVLTITASISNRIFCVHGGLSPAFHTLDGIRILFRFGEVPHEGPISDLMWSDPDVSIPGWGISSRGAGYTFGDDVVTTFLHANNMDHILRAHQLCQEGFQVLFKNKLSTVWSAPNYCYRCHNIASILEIDEDLERSFNTFVEAPSDARKVPADVAAAAQNAKQGPKSSEYFT
eukprot:TRINITY_DN67169_c3_g2_i1.p1 TRINITY_DN67169_c3_g2~~TRINITY_DN67169_c3_g2_i1.p1  ORF type:complete len:319 (-),score=1.81 TRINITY_DN67169_c3_g2_i1:586-1542(-)